MKVTVLCEGQAEYYFVQNVLDPYLPADVKAVPLPVSGIAFGNVPFDMVRFAAEDEFTKRESPDLVTTMVDLYELSGWQSMDVRPNETALQRVHRIEESARTAFGDDRFLPYVQLFEYEALLFADLDELKNWIEPKAVDVLRDSLGDDWKPEEVNDGAETAPSKRIIAVDPTYEFNKKTVGPNVAKAISIPRLRDRCPHFDEWISELERLTGVNRGG